MTLYEGVNAVLDSLESAQADYVIVGAFATNRWGIPRATDDADFVVAMAGAELNAILSSLPDSLILEPQARMELFTGTFRWVMQIAKTNLKIEIFILGSDPHHQEIFRRKRRERIQELNREAWIAGPEDLIIQKLRWARTKDIADVETLLGVQGPMLDYAHIEAWCAKHGTVERLRGIQATIPPVM